MAKSDYKVINVLADGTVIDDMTGYVLPYNNDTKVLYNFVANFLSGGTA